MQEQNKTIRLLCKRIPYDTEYKVWGIWSPKVAWASRSPKPPNSRKYVWVWKLSYFLWYQEFFYTGFSCELYQLHFLQLHTVPKTSLTCKGSTSFGPFAMLCCLTSLCLQNDMWLGQDGDDLVKRGWLLYEAWLGGFMGLLRASDAVELKDFISSSCIDVFSGSGMGAGSWGIHCLVGGKGRHMCG